MMKITELIRLIRPINCLITFISVWIGAVVAGDTHLSPEIFAAALSAFFIAAFGNVTNDIFDIVVDSIGKPDRPLVKGTISKKDAQIAAVILAGAGLALSFAVGAWATLVALVAIAALLAYTPFLKGIPFVGNLTVAVIAALAFVYGGMAVGRPFGALILSGFAFLMHFGRELVKDIEDRAADARAGHRTAATLSHARPARLAAIVIFTLLIVATFIPAAIGFYGAGYFLAVLIGTDFFLVESAHLLARTKSKTEMHRIAVWLKVAMPFGLLAVLIGHLGRR
jgi:geranylgeranylglycerol-phosphate geranylgeranyltransferase